ncbi:arginine--tRNA ligase [Elysia marginata]|uniref:arginine--tRNA ligase n=1 Tax=Elysia marginata TaxID=1093978 RepID=A0AAV4GFB3_9GAST|nr:arginine--tRNA ligase [Elysia marginata]
MVAWHLYGNGETPQTSKLKGDALVGKYYVIFDKIYKKEVQTLIDEGVDEENAKKQAPIFQKAVAWLQKWEDNDPDIIQLWKTMNSWVYKGFEETYQKLGVDFHKLYYESETYLLGKEVIEKGLEKGILYKKNDGSVWVDLSNEGLDEKLLLRADGTSVYITQDLGTALKRVEDFPDITSMIYTVGNEQDYHFKVLFLILKKLGYSWSNSFFHLSYGMVDLPDGKMKSREGTVVDADTLIDEMEDTARKISEEAGKTTNLPEEGKKSLYHTIGMGALKFFILKVDPQKRILFNPKESIDFNGNTGPFIQYTYARIKSLLSKAHTDNLVFERYTNATAKEKELIKQIEKLKPAVMHAADSLNPGIVANYVYDLVKLYNSYYQSTPILNTQDEDTKKFRLLLSKKVGDIIKYTLALLGITAPEQM